MGNGVTGIGGISASVICGGAVTSLPRPLIAGAREADSGSADDGDDAEDADDADNADDGGADGGGGADADGGGGGGARWTPRAGPCWGPGRRPPAPAKTPPTIRPQAAAAL